MHSEVNIWSLVKSLLHKYNCVIVPGLGGFIAHQQSAIVDPVSNVINPPCKYITFNAQLTLNDGLLVTQVADYLKINYIDAIKIVDEEINNFHQLLKNNSQFAIEGLGNFVLNSADKLIFSPEKNANFLIHSFGLAAVKLNQTSSVKFTKIISNAELLNADKKIETPFVSTNLSSNNTHSESKNIDLIEPKHNKKRRGNGLAFTAIGTFLILILGINAYIFLQEGNLTPIRNKFDELDLGLKIKSIFVENKTETNPLNNEELLAIYNPENIQKNASFNTEMFPIDPLIKEVKISYFWTSVDNNEEEITPINTTETTLEETPKLDSENSSETISSTVQNGVFYIIAGAFKSEKKANKLLDELKKDGFKQAEVILNPKAKSKHLKYFVSYSKHTDKNEIINELNTINENENPDAWIFENK